MHGILVIMDYWISGQSVAKTFTISFELDDFKISGLRTGWSGNSLDTFWQPHRDIIGMVIFVRQLLPNMAEGNLGHCSRYIHGFDWWSVLISPDVQVDITGTSSWWHSNTNISTNDMSSSSYILTYPPFSNVHCNSVIQSSLTFLTW